MTDGPTYCAQIVSTIRPQRDDAEGRDFRRRERQRRSMSLARERSSCVGGVLQVRLRQPVAGGGSFQSARAASGDMIAEGGLADPDDPGPLEGPVCLGIP